MYMYVHICMYVHYVKTQDYKVLDSNSQWNLL